MNGSKTGETNTMISRAVGRKEREAQKQGRRRTLVGEEAEGGREGNKGAEKVQ